MLPQGRVFRQVLELLQAEAAGSTALLRAVRACLSRLVLEQAQGRRAQERAAELGARCTGAHSWDPRVVLSLVRATCAHRAKGAGWQRCACGSCSFGGCCVVLNLKLLCQAAVSCSSSHSLLQLTQRRCSSASSRANAGLSARVTPLAHTALSLSAHISNARASRSGASAKYAPSNIVERKPLRQHACNGCRS